MKRCVILETFSFYQNKPDYARETLRHALRHETPWVLCDSMPFLHLMAASQNEEIRKLLLDAIREPRNSHAIGGLRSSLKAIFTRTKESLASPH